ncbi:hypothetical protein AJ80_09893 [Polytolypa hystricis UAMH7299]|uniref:Uncharacterized protein n=1 Tax=Polytolypa hystricis (strain UAMH7299) TaxID=1447883 RepID=A0A2B7WGY9_POLH7|nr:hypothetical protein AJ80_09893 [Polytolypa hystricis UAMH7299]
MSAKAPNTLSARRTPSARIAHIGSTPASATNLKGVDESQTPPVTGVDEDTSKSRMDDSEPGFKKITEIWDEDHSECTVHVWEQQLDETTTERYAEFKSQDLCDILLKIGLCSHEDLRVFAKLKWGDLSSWLEPLEKYQENHRETEKLLKPLISRISRRPQSKYI